MGDLTQSRSAVQAEPRGGNAGLLRRGHWHSLELLEDTRAVVTTLERYERAIGHPVYLRPTNNGLTVVSLDSSAPAMLGVGGSYCCIDALPPTEDAVEADARAYRAKLGAIRRESIEERYVIGRVRAALSERLELGSDLLFVHQEWRFPNAGKIDLLAVDRQTGQLVVIEAKESEAAAKRERDAKGRSAAEQAAEYVTHLIAYASECEPYLERLARALAKLYRRDDTELCIDLGMAPRWEVWWPGGRLVTPADEH
jgi:hypothetical protein